MKLSGMLRILYIPLSKVCEYWKLVAGVPISAYESTELQREQWDEPQWALLQTALVVSMETRAEIRAAVQTAV